MHVTISARPAYCTLSSKVGHPKEMVIELANATIQNINIILTLIYLNFETPRMMQTREIIPALALWI